MFVTFKNWVKQLKHQVITLMFASRHPDTPFLPKMLLVLTVAYALSPIDLIPDFVPIIGYLDDMVIVPAGIWLCLKLTPPQVLADAKTKASEWVASHDQKPSSKLGLVMVVLIWCVLAYWMVGYAKALHI